MVKEVTEEDDSTNESKMSESEMNQESDNYN